MKIGFTELDIPSSKLAELLSDESFVRWIKGKAASEEQKKWDRWLQADDSRRTLVSRAQALYNLPFKYTEEQDTSFQCQRLQKKLRDNKKVKEKLPSIGRKRPTKQKWIPYAAAAGIILVFSFLFALNHWNTSSHLKTIRTAYGQTDSVKIGDSFIVLNANSTLRYNPARIEKKDSRMILDGEAYFSIEHRPGRTLKIVTDDGTIKDLGTEFDVSTRNNQTRVALVKGRVKVISNDTSAADRKKNYVMHPGELAIVSGSIKSITVQKKADLNLYTSWIHNIMTFNNTPFKEIVRKVEATYGKKVIVKDPELLNERITGSIGNANLDVLLDGLSQTLGVHMKQKGNRILVQKPDHR